MSDELFPVGWNRHGQRVAMKLSGMSWSDVVTSISIFQDLEP